MKLNSDWDSDNEEAQEEDGKDPQSVGAFHWMLVISTNPFEKLVISQNGFIFPNVRGENKKIIETTT